MLQIFPLYLVSAFGWVCRWMVEDLNEVEVGRLGGCFRNVSVCCQVSWSASASVCLRYEFDIGFC